MAPEYFLSNKSVGFVSPLQTVILQLMAPFYMAIWQLLLQNMADVGYRVVGTDIPHVLLK